MISTIISAEEFIGNNSTGTPYVLPFRVLAASHLRVAVTDADGVVAQLENGVDFTVSGAGGNSFSFTTAAAVPVSSRLTATVSMPLVQDANYQNHGRFDAETFERSLDYLTLLTQAISAGVGNHGDRAVLLPSSDPQDLEQRLPVAILRRDCFLHFDPATGAVGIMSKADLTAAVLTAAVDIVNGTSGSLFARRDAANTFAAPNTFQAATTLGSLTVTGNTVLGGTLTASGAINVTGNLHGLSEVSSDGAMTAGGTLTVGSYLTVNGGISSQVATLTDQANLLWDFTLANLAQVTLGGNRTLANPGGVRPGFYTLRVKQDGTGNRTLAWDSNFRFPAGTPPTLTTTANRTDVFVFANFGGSEIYLVASSLNHTS